MTFHECNKHTDGQETERCAKFVSLQQIKSCFLGNDTEIWFAVRMLTMQIFGLVVWRKESRATRKFPSKLCVAYALSVTAFVLFKPVKSLSFLFTAFQMP